MFKCVITRIIYNYTYIQVCYLKKHTKARNGPTEGKSVLTELLSDNFYRNGMTIHQKGLEHGSGRNADIRGCTGGRKF